MIDHDITVLYGQTAVEPQLATRVRSALASGSVLAAGGGLFFAEPSGACVALLREYIRDLRAPSDDEARASIRSWATLPVPHLPNPAPPEIGFVEDTDELDSFVWVDPHRIVPNRNIDEEFVERTLYWVEEILTGQASAESLTHLFGTMDLDGSSDIHGEAWDTPRGPIIRITVNGNHRLAALAALGVPCVLARVHWHRGSFEMPFADREEYRRLLQAFEVAAFPGGSQDSISAFSEWPILLTSAADAVASLAAFEERVGARTPGPIGELPRELFDDVDALEHAAAQIHRVQRHALLPAIATSRSRLGKFLDRIQGL